MPKPIIIDKAHARRFLLAHLRLLPPRTLRGKQGVLDYIRHVNCIQYDPINVVGQNPHLVLQSRVRGYKPAMLDALLYEDRKLVDGFDKQMSIYPVEDWPQFAYYRKRRVKRYMDSEETAAAAKLVKRIRKEIEARGPLSSLDLEEDTRMDWWLAGSVRAVRIALDILLYGGETIVHHRVGTRRYFDLSERVLPPKVVKASKPHASQEEYLEWHVFRRAGGLGLVQPKATAAYGGTIGWRGGRIRAAILRLSDKGRLVPVAVEELPRQRFFIRRDDLPALEAAAKGYRGRQGAALIAPLDNLMWDINLVGMLFNFRYAWEVYKPAEVEVEHLFSDRVMAALTRLAEPPAEPVNERPVLLACAAEEQHCLPVYALAAALAVDHRVATRVLGARTPYTALGDAMRRLGPAVVFVWSQRPETGDPAPLASLPALRPPSRVVVGGGGWWDGLPAQVSRVASFSEALGLIGSSLR